MTDYKFDPDDVGDKDAEDNDDYPYGGISTGGEDELDTDTDTDLSDSTPGLSSIVLLPFTVFAVYAFLEKSAVLGALTSLFGGASGVASVVATGAWVAGAIVTSFIALLALATVVLLLVGLVTRNGGKFGLGVLGAMYFGAGYLGAVNLFSGLPLLVGFVLTTSLLGWGLVVLIGGLAIIIGIIIA